MSQEAPRHWRLNKQRYAMVGEICLSCEEVIFPPRDICPNCKQEARTPYVLNGKGQVVSWTIIDRDEAPEEFKVQAPYIVAQIQTDDGPVVTAQITDLDWKEEKVVDASGDWHWEKKFDVEMGMRVEMVTRKLKEDGEKGILVYGYKFRRPIGVNQEDNYPLVLENSLADSLAEAG